MQKVSDIRAQFVEKYKAGEFVTDKTGVNMVEIIGATFVADEASIFGTVAGEYVERELAWYTSMSLNVNDIPPPVPAIWKQVAASDGTINSNYGWMIWSEENGNQYDRVLEELCASPLSRRATMIYQRPSMWYEYNTDGRSDFCCTYAHQYFIRDGKLVVHALLRSNDAVFGYKNDFAWAKHVQEKLLGDLHGFYPALIAGDIIWTASSLHVYERHFKFIEEAI